MQLRLIGLALIITSIILALAAAATQTTHIRIKQPESQTASDTDGQPFVLPPEPVKFTSIPILWPLLLAGGLGTLLWFATPTGSRSAGSKRRRR